MDIRINKEFFKEYCQSVYTAIMECGEEYQRVVINYYDWSYCLIKKGMGFSTRCIDLPIIPCRKLSLEEFMDLIVQTTEYNGDRFKTY